MLNRPTADVIRDVFRLGGVGFFLIIIATLTLSSAALLVGWLLAERKPTASPAGGADPASGNANGRMPRDTFQAPTTARAPAPWRKGVAQDLQSLTGHA